MNFNSSTVLITGGGRGLGLAYARLLGQLGATVLIQDNGAASDGESVDPQVVEDAAATLRSEGLTVRAIAGDISTREGCYALFNRAEALAGQVNTLIHSAGWVAYQPVEAIGDAAFDRMMTIAAKAPLWLAQAAWPGMKAAGYGRIVVTTSCRALYPQYVQHGLTAYAASRMAVVGIMHVLAAEGAESGIVVNAVSPVAKTRMWGVDGEPDDLRPADVAPGVAFLASPACREGGWILRAANGQFHATRAAEASGVHYPYDLRAVHAATPDAVAANWAQIAVHHPEPRG